jgi:hypothetical protein
VVYFFAFRLADQYFRILTLTALRWAADIRRPLRRPLGRGLLPAMAVIAERTLSSCFSSCRSARFKSSITAWNMAMPPPKALIMSEVTMK